MRRTVRFYNNLCNHPSAVLRACFQTSYNIRQHRGSWFNLFIRAVMSVIYILARSRLRLADFQANQLQHQQPLHVAHIASTLQSCYQREINCQVDDPEDPECRHRTLSAYVRWFWCQKFRKLPAYLMDAGLADKFVLAMMRFRTLNWKIPVHNRDRPFEHRLCSVCAAATLQGSTRISDLTPSIYACSPAWQ